ncbi:L,D-transpeptidase LdtMt2 [Actinomadura kijaniata]|uniref:Lipoprotein-anchoring transpeptidase ErfK/SrfK n=1 Tax=Actinomadura namibiensis TaxID=182080 RepID=A0A7W3LPU8_ACTNM|nr:Ig-like domain-containing protein [Actinomadura namibiensis]MBA8951975.1 lipoprotein-anchoring transpeptidase ErfK/SrfK [Actinomadura namibiensis]
MRLIVPLAALVSAALASAACGGDDPVRERPAGAAGPASPSAPPAIAVIPADGTAAARPDRGIVVTALRGTLTRVAARAGGRPVPGRLSADRRVWRSRWTLRPGAVHAVAATGTAGSATARFTTLRPAQTFRIADVTPLPGETVGVGMPLIVTFDRPIADRAAVERALEVRMSRRVAGAWRWTDARQAVFRPRRYWPAGQRVTLLAHTAGVRSAPGVFGAADHVAGFRVGPSRISVVDVRRHRMTVRVNGRPARSAGISAGKGGTRAYTTTSGVHLTMAKGDPVIMTSDWMGVTDRKDPRYYRKEVRHAVQISASGEYVHAAPWSVAQQGRANVSHGCVNASPEFARWFYDQTLRGDVVLITGTDRPLEWNNGWGYWQIPWTRWVMGSALRKPAAPGRPRT